MENGLMIPDCAALAPQDDAVFKAISTSGGFLPRLQLMVGTSEQCKDGSFPVNHFALVVDKEFMDLGIEIDFVALTYRPKALSFGSDPVVSVYDVAAPAFKEIQDRSETKNSKCMYGPEFLVWLPSRAKFATLYMGSKTARRDAPFIRANMKKLLTLKPNKIEGKTDTYYSAKAYICSEALEAAPDIEKLTEVATKFLNPPKTVVEPKADIGTKRET